MQRFVNPRCSPDPRQDPLALAEWAARSPGSWHLDRLLSSSAAGRHVPAPDGHFARQPCAVQCCHYMPEKSGFDFKLSAFHNKRYNIAKDVSSYS